jgi:hypothetical protein
MNGGTRIIAIGGNGEEPGRDDFQLQSEASPPEAIVEDAPEEEEMPAPRSRGWLLPVVAGLIVVAWTMAFIWAKQAEIAAFPPAQWPTLIGDWTLPVLLVCVLWLLAMRTSRREAGRFGDAAQRLSEESIRLETRLATVNRELSLAREFIAAQSRDLESLGRVAADRLSQNADRLAALIRENDARVETIGTVSQAALENMEKLRGQLPVIASSAKDVTNNIGNAGRTAQSQLQDMVNGFGRLNDFGQASERQVQKLRGFVDEAISEFARQAEQLDGIASARFTSLAERGAEFRTQLDGHEIDALAAIRSRAAAMAEELEQTRHQLDGQEAESLTSLRSRLTALRDEGASVSRSLRDGEGRAVEAWQAAATTVEETVRGRIAILAEELEKTRQQVNSAEAESLAALHTRLFALRDEGAAISRTLRDGENKALDTLTAGLARTEAELRGRAAAMAQDIEALHDQLDTSEAESLTSLRARVTALRDEGSNIARALREGEARALDSWQAAIARMEEALTQAIASVDQADSQSAQSARARLNALLDEGDRFEAGLAERARIFSGELNRKRAEGEASDQQALARLAEQLSVLDAEIADRRSGHERQSAILVAHAETIGNRLGTLGQQMVDIATQGGEAEATIGASLDTLAQKLTASRSALTGTDEKIAALTDASVRLLELLQASVAQTGHDLPQAMASSEQRLADIERRAAELDAAVGAARSQGEELSRLVTISSADLRAALGEMETLHDRLGERSGAHGATLAELRATLDTIEVHNERIAASARDELSTAIDALAASVGGAVSGIRDDGAKAVSALAGQLGKESAAAIDKAMRTSANEVAGQLEQAASHAAGVAREAAIQLRDQLAKVDDLAGNLERRVAHARQRAEEQVDNDFTRRVALLTESLNSNAIDIAKAMSTDVSDTAWAAYLRGDRGIFTRRAVRLLDNGEAKAVAQIYERDDEFREHVRRFIHDFEAILRQVLSARDGHALGVTLLSSDMGKLYVALAQAIERLRN